MDKLEMQSRDYLDALLEMPAPSAEEVQRVYVKTVTGQAALVGVSSATKAGSLLSLAAKLLIGLGTATLVYLVVSESRISSLKQSHLQLDPVDAHLSVGTVPLARVDMRPLERAIEVSPEDSKGVEKRPSTKAVHTAAAKSSRSEQELIADARSAMRAGDWSTSQGLLQKHRDRYRRGSMAEERDALWISVLLRTGRHRQAEKRANRFLKAFPKSLHQARIALELSKAKKTSKEEKRVTELQRTSQ